MLMSFLDDVIPGTGSDVDVIPGTRTIFVNQTVFP